MQQHSVVVTFVGGDQQAFEVRANNRAHAITLVMSVLRYTYNPTEQQKEHYGFLDIDDPEDKITDVSWHAEGISNAYRHEHAMSEPNFHRAAARLERARSSSKDVARIAREIEEAAKALGMYRLRHRAAKIRRKTNGSEHSIPDYIDRVLEEMPN